VRAHTVRRADGASQGKVDDRWKYSPPPALQRCIQVIAIDLVLAGDNAIVIGMAAAGLPAEQRRGGLSSSA
jgi:predicted tellurium resistance membrane protein TerC